MSECFFAPYSDRPCGWPMQKCHLIPKQILKRRLGYTDDQVWADVLWVDGCWDHHQLFDGGYLPVPRSDLPIDFLEWLQEDGHEREADIVAHDFRLCD